MFTKPYTLASEKQNDQDQVTTQYKTKLTAEFLASVTRILIQMTDDKHQNPTHIQVSVWVEIKDDTANATGSWTQVLVNDQDSGVRFGNEIYDPFIRVEFSCCLHWLVDIPR